MGPQLHSSRWHYRRGTCELKERKGCLVGAEAAGLLQRETPSLYFRPSTVRHPCEDSPSRTPVAASLSARCQTEERPWGTKTDVTQFMWSESPGKKRQTFPGLRWVGGALGPGAELWGRRRGEPGPRARRGSAPRGGDASQTCPCPEEYVEVTPTLRGQMESGSAHPCVLLVLCPTPQHPLVSLKKFLCPE